MFMIKAVTILLLTIIHCLQMYATGACVESVWSSEYTGRVSVTRSGIQCQAWASQYPYQHEMGDSSTYYPDATVEEAENYCRNPSNSEGTWCYTVSNDTRWEYCNLKICPSGELLCIP